MLNRLTTGIFIAGISISLPGVVFAQAKEYGGVIFPQGDRSFAESVVEFTVNDPEVGPGWDDPTAALGPPDDKAVALGNAVEGIPPGELIVAFDSHRLIDIEGDDLYIFEIGPEVEATEVAISTDLITWYDLGRIEGSTRGIDLADYPEVPSDHGFRYVRLRDYPDGHTSGAPFPGPDIDAVGAIGSLDARFVAEDGRIISVDDNECSCPDDTDMGCSSVAPGTNISFPLLLIAAMAILRLGRRRRRILPGEV